MAKSAKVSRKDLLKEPDQFLSGSEKAMLYFVDNKATVIGAVVSIFIGMGSFFGFNYFKETQTLGNEALYFEMEKVVKNAKGSDPINEVKLIVDLIYEGGLENMRYSISNTAEFGDYVSGPKVVNADAKEEMRAILKRIQSGEFANEFIADCRESNDGKGGPRMKEYRQQTSEHSIEKVGAELRAMMPWIAQNKIVDKAKN